MTLEHRIDAVGKTIQLLANRLTARGFVFDRPEEVFPGPEPGATQAISRIEREIGTVPLAMKLFWQNVGSVNFCGSHPDWKGCDNPDALVVFPPSFAISELDDFLSDREERLRHNLPYLIPIAPGDLHKINVSGGMWYNVSVPAAADDPPLNDEWHHTTLVAYLEEAVKWAGFPGLWDCHGHMWPVDDLTKGIYRGS